MLRIWNEYAWNFWFLPFKKENKKWTKTKSKWTRHFEMIFIKSIILSNSARSNCTDGYLKIFLKGQETQDAYDKFDYEFCGEELPHQVVSDGPQLAMIFSSGELQAKGFKVRFVIQLKLSVSIAKLIDLSIVSGEIYIRNGIQDSRYASTGWIVQFCLSQHIAQKRRI